MTIFNKTVYTLTLRDLASDTKPEFIGYFKNEHFATEVGTELQKPPEIVFNVEKETLNIEVFETYEDYIQSVNRSHLASALSKLTPEEYDALKTKIESNLKGI